MKRRHDRPSGKQFLASVSVGHRARARPEEHLATVPGEPHFRRRAQPQSHSSPLFPLLFPTQKPYSEFDRLSMHRNSSAQPAGCASSASLRPLHPRLTRGRPRYDARRPALVHAPGRLNVVLFRCNAHRGEIRDWASKACTNAPPSIGLQKNGKFACRDVEQSLYFLGVSFVCISKSLDVISMNPHDGLAAVGGRLVVIAAHALHDSFDSPSDPFRL